MKINTAAYNLNFVHFIIEDLNNNLASMIGKIVKLTTFNKVIMFESCVVFISEEHKLFDEFLVGEDFIP